MKASVEKLKGIHNYNLAFIAGSKNLQPLSFKSHAVSEMHTRAMFLLKKKQSSDVHEHASIARTLHSMGPASRESLMLSSSLVLRLSRNIKNNQVCATFVEHIALE